MRMKKSNRGKIVGFVSVILVLVILVGGYFVYSHYTGFDLIKFLKTPSDTTIFVKGATLNGQDIEGKTPKEAAEVGRTELSKIQQKLKMDVKFKEDTVSLTDEDFTITDILDIILPQNLLEFEGKDYGISYVVDLSDKGRKKILSAAEKHYTEGKDAELDKYDEEKEKFSFKDEVKGSRVDVQQTIKAVEAQLAKKQGGSVEAVTEQTSPKLTKAMLEKNFVELASYSTESSNTENGNSNMALAMSHCNGTILNPGEEFSFNTVIGDSTTQANGYLPAGGVLGGVIVPMVGGGICQASSTLYGAVMRAGLEIVFRDCHGLESTYCPTGQDAMVDYGNVDFKFKNNLEYPVYVYGGMDGTTIYCSIYGVQPDSWDEIEIESGHSNTYAALSTVTYVQDYSLGRGQYVMRTSGSQGFESYCNRLYYKNGELIETEALPSSYYAPRGMIYAYGPGTDVSKIKVGYESGNTN